MSILKALQNEDVILATDCIRKGDNLYEQDDYGNIPLHYAAGLGYIELIHDFLRKGVAVDYQNRRGQTPLIYAMEYGRREAARVLWSYQSKTFRNDGSILPKLIIELCTIGANETLPWKEPSSGFVQKSQSGELIPHQRARKIGQQIYEMGGNSAMLKAGETVKSILGGGAANNLSWCWDEIGEWMW